MMLTLLVWFACTQREPYYPPETETESDADTDTDTDTDTDADVVDCSEPWSSQVEFSAQAAWMNACVMEDMAEIFYDFDPVMFDSITCETCHGSDLAGGSYKMPGLERYNPGDDEWGPFMSGEVRPLMAEMLGVEEFDPQENPDGFSCNGCHSP